MSFIRYVAFDILVRVVLNVAVGVAVGAAVHAVAVRRFVTGTISNVGTMSTSTVTEAAYVARRVDNASVQAWVMGTNDSSTESVADGFVSSA